MDPMEEIWNTVAKTGKDGKRCISLKGTGDLAFLYLSGFVDVKKHDFKSWINAFTASKLPDGSYAVSHDQWVEKRPFRYDGPIGTPFDPNAIQEKEYSEQDFIKLMTEKVLPNTQFDPSNIPQMLTYLKQQRKLTNGKVTLDKGVKTEVMNLIATYPHPMAVLQKMVQALKEGKGTVVTMAQEQAQKSRFVAGMSAPQTAQQRLNEISKAMQKEAAPIPESQVPAIDLKALKKKRPPTGRI